MNREISVDNYDTSDIDFVKKMQDCLDSGNAFLASVISVRDHNIKSVEDLKKKNIPIPEPTLMFKGNYEVELIKSLTLDFAGALVKGETDIDYLAWYLYCSYIWMSGTIFLVPKWVGWLSRSTKMLQSWGVYRTKNLVTDALCRLLEGSDDNVMMATCFYDCVLAEGYAENVVCALYDKDRLEKVVRSSIAVHLDNIKRKGDGYLDVLESINEHLLGIHEKGLF